MDNIGLKIKKAKGLAVGVSKVGGKPSLPEGFVWPVSKYSEEPLGFVCQINMAELQASMPTGELPKQGLLQLFCSLDESELSSPSPSHKIVFHANPAALEEAEFPDGINLSEATLDERQISFDAKSDDGRVFGTDPQFSRSELQGIFDGKNDALLLDLPAYSNVARVKEKSSIFGDGEFFLIIPQNELKEGNLEKAHLIFEGGS